MLGYAAKKIRMLMEVGITAIAFVTMHHIRGVFPQTNKAGTFKIAMMTVNAFWVVWTVFRKLASFG